ncbi:unnamed protein product [Leptosia nina]|uniref:Uncharacterized protein n=1 Tax=Leptosia nina TaxID=320188 RepID=A0AAV1K755_9NEOP
MFSCGSPGKDMPTVAPVARGHVTFLLQGRAPPSLIHGRASPRSLRGLEIFCSPHVPEGFHLRTVSRSRRDIARFCSSFWRASTLFRSSLLLG